MTEAQTPILLTRPTEASKRFEARLRAEGIALPVVISPVLRIEHCEARMPETMAGAIFTSMNGVAAVEGRDLPAWCVGWATAEAAQAKGWQTKTAEGEAESLLRRILADAPKGPLVHFRGEHARVNVAARLREHGFDASEVVVYRQEAEPLSEQAKALLGREKHVVLPLFSPRSAAQVAMAGPFIAPLTIVAISEAVAHEAKPLNPVRMIVTDAPDSELMVEAIKQFAGAACRIETDGDSA
ncbi:MAG: uroporphyrinogen-III synthase [Pseudopelagicola sp.]|nr:uroporphyrinogen-III synthase [Pseudopelagicola sp.]